MELQKDGSLIVSDFSKGIGQSILSDYSDMMGVNIDSNPGLASANFKFNKVMESLPAQTFTVITDNIVVSTAISFRGQEDYIPVTLTTTGTLPTGLSTGTVYYLWKTADKTYRLRPQIKGSGYASITAGTGSGTHTVTPITPSSIKKGCWAINSQGRVYALDSNNRLWFVDQDGVFNLWYLIAGNTSTGAGNGVIYYKGYVIVMANTKFDCLKDIQSPISDTIIWYNDFVSGTIDTSSGSNLYLSTNDDSIYFSNGTSTGRYYKVGMFEEVPTKTFNPEDNTTFSLVSEAVTLPFEYGGYSTAINEISEYLIIGTGSDKVYFWDKKSPSFTSFIRLREKNVQSIEVVDNIAYIFAGNNGSIYIANTASSNFLTRVPEQVAGEYYGSFDINVNSTMLYKRELLFSISFAPTSTTIENYLMSYNFDTKALTKKNISSYGATGERNGIFYGRIHSMYQIGENILISSSSYDISDDKYTYAVESLMYLPTIGFGSLAYYTYSNYEPYIITGLISLGQVYNKKTFRELQVAFSRALTTGQGIKVYYRYDDSSAWTLLKTIDYTTLGSIKDVKTEAPISDIIDLQIKIELSGVNLTSPLLKYVRLIP